jgi:hypothetical protein
MIKLVLNLSDALIVLKDIDTEFVDKYIFVHKRCISIYDTPVSCKQWIEYGEHDDRYENSITDTINIGLWPTKTTLLCWYCTRDFINYPIGIPYKKTLENDVSTIYTIGCFCSFSCAFTWNKYRSNRILLPSNIWDTESLIYNLYYICGGKDAIVEAPPKEILLKYGGKLSDEEYGKLLDNNKTYLVSISMPPMISLFHIIDIKKIETSKSQLIIPPVNSKYRLFRKKSLYSVIGDFFK